MPRHPYLLTAFSNVQLLSTSQAKITHSSPSNCSFTDHPSAIWRQINNLVLSMDTNHMPTKHLFTHLTHAFVPSAQPLHGHWVIPSSYESLKDNNSQHCIILGSCPEKLGKISRKGTYWIKSWRMNRKSFVPERVAFQAGGVRFTKI